MMRGTRGDERRTRGNKQGKTGLSGLDRSRVELGGVVWRGVRGAGGGCE